MEKINTYKNFENNINEIDLLYNNSIEKISKENNKDFFNET